MEIQIFAPAAGGAFTFSQPCLLAGPYAAVVGCIENMRSGVTTVLDYMYAHGSQTGLDDAVVQAFDETGIRGILGRTHTKTNNFAKGSECPINETEDMFFQDVERLAKELQGHERITLALAPGIVWDLGEEGFRKVRQYADRYGFRITMHLDETEDDDKYSLEKYGVNTVELLDRNGFLGEDFIGVHLVHLDEKSLDILQKRRVKVSHNPVSNMVVASGVAPIPELKRRGLDIGLGTDGAAANDTQNMLEVIKTTAILHKCIHRDATLFPAIDVLKMATIEGARVVGREEEIGSLEVGKKADFFLFNPKNVACVPIADPIASLVYSANPGPLIRWLSMARLLWKKASFFPWMKRPQFTISRNPHIDCVNEWDLGSIFKWKEIGCSAFPR